MVLADLLISVAIKHSAMYIRIARRASRSILTMVNDDDDELSFFGPQLEVVSRCTYHSTAGA